MKTPKKQMKTKIIFFLLVCCTSSYSQQSILGKYIGKETKRVLELSENGHFTMLNDRDSGVFKQDTLSFGNWKYEEGFIVLNTPKSINSNVLKINVVESVIDSDTLKIEINNPYEKYFHKEQTHYPRFFNYFFQINSVSGKYGPFVSINENYTYFPKDKNEKIYNIKVFIVPLSFYYPSTLAFNFLETEVYHFKNMQTNYIKVDIPDFTFDYIGYERYREEYVKIKKRKLLLRGEIFERIK